VTQARSQAPPANSASAIIHYSGMILDPDYLLLLLADNLCFSQVTECLSTTSLGARVDDVRVLYRRWIIRHACTVHLQSFCIGLFSLIYTIQFHQHMFLLSVIVSSICSPAAAEIFLKLEANEKAQ
jgi:hypothetical protein